MRSVLVVVVVVLVLSAHIEAAVMNGRQRVFRNLATGLCLSAVKDDNTLKVGICDRSQEQRWVITAANELRVLADSSCVTSEDSTSVYSDECTSDSNQKWSFRNGQVKNEATGKCLDTDANFNIIGAACLNADYQKWYVSFITDVKSD